ncbi:DUF6957 family protein [Pseudomonas sp. S2_H01]|jgi:hypothetical protein
MNDVLHDVVELLNGPGEAMVGFNGSEDQAEAAAILLSNGKQYCLVRDWMIIEIEVTDAFRESLAQDGLEPYVLYAGKVVCHSTMKRQRNDWVRSTFQRSLREGYVFETRNTAYLLFGAGQRKKARAETVMAIVE